jgi:hypothetical protein
MYAGVPTTVKEALVGKTYLTNNNTKSIILNVDFEIRNFFGGATNRINICVSGNS